MDQTCSLYFAEIANGYDDFNDMLIYLEFYPNHKILIS
ncbi:hypothetical protein MXS87_19770 [Escherichia coli]|nr:hypothetical protein [Escherichia coli]